MSSDRTEKLFRLLGSDNDAEAMSALRFLRQLKTKNGRNWNQFVDELAAVQFGQSKPAEKTFAWEKNTFYGNQSQSANNDNYEDLLRRAREEAFKQEMKKAFGAAQQQQKEAAEAGRAAWVQMREQEGKLKREEVQKEAEAWMKDGGVLGKVARANKARWFKGV